MTIEPKRAGILLTVFTLGMGVVFILPKALGFQPLGVREMAEIPDEVGEWFGKDEAISDNERTTLGAGTEFSRKKFTTFGSFEGKRLKLYSNDTTVLMSIVLSGQDMNTSIHRPERCLPTQGWNIADTREMAVNVPERGSFNVTRLYNTKLVREGGKPVEKRILNYYWFVGHSDVTGSHMARTFIDMKDRLLSGYNQRWAYVTLSVNVRALSDPQKQAEYDMTVDEMVCEFIRQFVPLVVKDTVKLE